MGTAAKRVRAKLSTTVSLQTYQYLERKVKSGEAESIAEALDESIYRVRRIENRERLAKVTEAYFNQLSPAAIAEESELARDVASLSDGIDFDDEL
jgi:hypothetical protein